MKLEIDITEDEYKKVCTMSKDGIGMKLYDMIAEGTPITKFVSPKEQPIPTRKSSAYNRKGYYALTEENYWYLKDIAFYKGTQIQDYLNYLIELDRDANKDVWPMLPHTKNK